MKRCYKMNEKNQATRPRDKTVGEKRSHYRLVGWRVRRRDAMTECDEENHICKDGKERARDESEKMRKLGRECSTRPVDYDRVISWIVRRYDGMSVAAAAVDGGRAAAAERIRSKSKVVLLVLIVRQHGS